MHLRTLLLSACLWTALPAQQMSGTYLIDPAGTGATFTSFTAAVNAMFVNGVSGPCEFLVFPGTYTESVMVPPIPGTSASNTVTFRPMLGLGTVSLVGGAGDTFALLGVSFRHNFGLVFDGLDFSSAPGFAISGTSFVEGVEVRNCTFGANHRSTAPGEFRHALIVSENSGSEAGWKIHHNQITVPNHTSRTAYGVYLSNGGGWEIHHNAIDLNGTDYGLYLINNNTRLDTIYDNLFVGSLANRSASSGANSVAAIAVDVSNFNNDICHNTFQVTIPGAGCLIATAGFGTNQNRIVGNIFGLTASGTCIAATSYSPPNFVFTCDANVYWAPAGEIGRLGPTTAGYTTLASWQAASGRDANSLDVDPQFVNGNTAPYNLHILPTSPAIGAARNTPAFVTTDYDGRFRDASPDAGAYESTGFALFGTGCAGTASLIPALGSSGTVQLGSTNFAVTLANAVPNALAVMVGGVSITRSGSTPLPFDLGGGCRVLVSTHATVVAFTNAVGGAQMPLVIPNSNALFGQEIYFQWLVADPAAPNQFGIVVSNAGALQL